MLLRRNSNATSAASASAEDPRAQPRVPLLVIANNGLKRFKRTESLLIKEDAAHFACNVGVDCLDRTSPGLKGYFCVISSDALLLYRQSKKMTHDHQRVVFKLEDITLVSKQGEFKVCIHFKAQGHSFSTGEPIRLERGVLPLEFHDNNVLSIDLFLQKMALARGDCGNALYFSRARLTERLDALLAKLDVPLPAKLHVAEAITKESENIDNQFKVALAFKLLEIAICCVSHYGDQVPQELEHNLVANSEHLYNSMRTFAQCIMYIDQTVAYIGDLPLRGAVAGRTALEMLYGISDSVGIRMLPVEKSAILGYRPLAGVMQELEQLNNASRFISFQQETIEGLAMVLNAGEGGRKKYSDVLSIGFQHPIRRMNCLQAGQRDFDDASFLTKFVANAERLTKERNAVELENDFDMSKLEMMIKGASDLYAPGRVCLANDFAILKSGNLRGKLICFDDCLIFVTTDMFLCKFHSCYELARAEKEGEEEDTVITLRTRLQRNETFTALKPEFKAQLVKHINEAQPIVPKRKLPSARNDSLLSRLSPAAFARGVSPRSASNGNPSDPRMRAGSAGGGSSHGFGGNGMSSRLGASARSLASFGRSTPTSSNTSSAEQARLIHRLSSESKSRATTPVAAAATLQPRPLLSRPLATPLKQAASSSSSALPSPSPMRASSPSNNQNSASNRRLFG